TDHRPWVLEHSGRFIAVLAAVVLMFVGLVGAKPAAADSPPYTVGWERTDTLGEPVYVGEVLTWTVTIKNVTDKPIAVKADESNVDGILTSGPEGAWKGAYLPPGVASTVKVRHQVVDTDVAAKRFVPRARFHTAS
ncbi:hypothetical protein, partial [Pseudoalteromonas sp. SYSU M81241]